MRKLLLSTLAFMALAAFIGVSAPQGRKAEKAKGGENTLHTPANRLTLSSDPTVMERTPKACRLIARPWDSGDPSWKYKYAAISFVVTGPGSAPANGQTNANGVYPFSVPAGQTIYAVLDGTPTIKSNTFKCDPSRTE